MWDVNVEGTRDLLTLAAEMGLQRIVHTSTIGTIGRPVEDRLPTEEDWFDDLESASPYARSKIAGERVALDLARRGAPVVVVNPCAPVGAGDIKPSSTGQRIIDYLQGRMPSFTAGGINFVSVEDVAQGHLLAAERGRAGQRYILGNATGNLLLTDFLHLMEQATGIARPGRRTMAGRVRGLARRILGRRAPAVAHPASGYRPPALTADPSLAIEELGLPQTPLEVAICQAMAWFREHGYVKGAAR
jgi:dihydroflavonol-4-reductase